MRSDVPMAGRHRAQPTFVVDRALYGLEFFEKVTGRSFWNRAGYSG